MLLQILAIAAVLTQPCPEVGGSLNAALDRDRKPEQKPSGYG